MEEARSNRDFYLYVVENVRQGDPALFTLRVLAGDRLLRLLERAKEQRYFTVPWPVARYDSCPPALTADGLRQTPRTRRFRLTRRRPEVTTRSWPSRHAALRAPCRQRMVSKDVRRCAVAGPGHDEHAAGNPGPILTSWTFSPPVNSPPAWPGGYRSGGTPPLPVAQRAHGRGYEAARLASCTILRVRYLIRQCS